MRRQEAALQIPRENEDLRAYVRKKRVKVWSLTLGWEAFWIVVFLYYRDREDFSFDYRFFLALAILLLVGMFLFGWVRLMLDRSWQGTITRIENKQNISFEPGRHRNSARYRAVPMLHLYAEETTGRRHKLVVPLKNHFDSYYHVGDRITYHSGLPFPESNDGVKGDIYVCSLCGGVELSDTDCCHGCGASLIKPARSRYAKEARKF